MRIRFLIALSVGLFVLSTAYVFTTAENKVPKYDNGGNLIDSNVSEVSGNVGIGTTPSSRFHTHTPAGTANLQYISTDTNVGSSNLAALWFVSDYDGTPNWAGIGQYNDGSLRLTSSGDISAPHVLVADDGKVGIGTTAPNNRLHVSSGWINVDLNYGLKFNDYSMFEANNNTVKLNAGGWGTVLIPSGNVGIGNITSPSAKLHVVGNGYLTGNLTVDGNIGAKYQDVAEWVDASMPAEAGAVVVADTERINHVRPHGHTTLPWRVWSHVNRVSCSAKLGQER